MVVLHLKINHWNELNEGNNIVEGVEHSATSFLVDVTISSLTIH